MLQRSCSLIKSVSTPTARNADIIGYTIVGFFNGTSQRQHHSLVQHVIKSRCQYNGQRFTILQNLFICQKRELIQSSYLGNNTDGKSNFPDPINNHKDRETQNLTTPVNSPVQSQTSSTGGIGTGDKKDSDLTYAKFENNAVKESKSDVKCNNVNKSTSNEQNNQNSIKKEENNVAGSQVNNESIKAAKVLLCEAKNGDSNNSSSSNGECKIFGEVAEQTKGKSFVENGQESKENHLIKGEDAKNVNSSARSADSVTSKPVNEAKVDKGKSIIIFEKAKNLLRKSKPEDISAAVTTSDESTSRNATHRPPPPRRRPSVDPNKCSTERNFITPVRAMTDFLLKPSDLEGLRKTKRRSPYENDPPITVYWRKDVEAKAIDVWGSKENLLKEILKRDIERRRYQQNIFTVKRRLRDYRREQGRETEFSSEHNGLFGSTGTVVLTATVINGINCLLKFGAWWYTGSHSMFSEALHSLADTVNQLILSYGIHKSVQRADSDHPYGYTNMRYVTSLISGVAIFCIGCGLSIYHGYIGLIDPAPIDSYHPALLALGISCVTEGATFCIAYRSVRKGAIAAQMSFWEYVLRGNDPSVNVVLLEDAAALLGVSIAGVAIGTTCYTNSHIPDAIGSLLVGGLLAVVATFIIYTNVAALVGRSIPQERLDKINAELESDVMIRAIHDVKGIDIGNSLVRYKAEMDFDGGELTRAYLDKQDLNQMLEEVRSFTTIDELEEFILKHGENIVDTLGGEIDRIELKLRKKHPEIRHCDLEIL